MVCIEIFTNRANGLDSGFDHCEKALIRVEMITHVPVQTNKAEIGAQNKDGQERQKCKVGLS